MISSEQDPSHSQTFSPGSCNHILTAAGNLAATGAAEADVEKSIYSYIH